MVGGCTIGAVEKLVFNRKDRKAMAKNAKANN
jgi:hypothetical protein